MLGHHAATVAFTAMVQGCAECEVIGDYVANLKMSESRVAAAYVQLALLQNSRRIARNRERRQRNESLLVVRTLVRPHPAGYSESHHYSSSENLSCSVASLDEDRYSLCFKSE